MRVNPNNIYGPSTTGAQGTGRAEGRNGSRAADSFDGGLDRADISQNASLASDVLRKSAAERGERIAELRSQYESGAYTVDPMKLGGRIVDEMLANSIR